MLLRALTAPLVLVAVGATCGTRCPAPNGPAQGMFSCFGSPQFDNAGTLGTMGRPPGPGFVANNGNAPYAACSCCSATYSQTLAQFGEGGLYAGFNYTCPGRPLSAKCRFYLEAQEADFACNPATQSTYYIAAIPLCSAYVAAWYDACANDYTCQDNWVTWPTNATTGAYLKCGSTEWAARGGGVCRTYASIFGADKSNLTSMWNSVYTYSTDTTVCKSLAPRNFEGTVAFPNGPNPNPVCSAVYSGASAASVGIAAAIVALVAAGSRAWD